MSLRMGFDGWHVTPKERTPSVPPADDSGKTF